MTSSFISPETLRKVEERNEHLLDRKTRAMNESPTTTSSINYVSIGTQCDWRNESNDKVSNLLSIDDETSKNAPYPENFSSSEQNVETSLMIRNWSSQSEQNTCHDHKLLVAATCSQQQACNLQTFPVDDKFFMQFDYKTRNKLKAKQRRLDPFYRAQERDRQRTVMRIKRKNPSFRALEREKGRYRMRLKRMDPIFRAQERDRQRERMKIKRSDPDFREREREKQKTRLHIKRLDPTYKEKERAQMRLRMRIKRQNSGIYSTLLSDINKLTSKNQTCTSVISQNSFKNVTDMGSSSSELKGTQIAFPQNSNTRLLSIKRESNSEASFNYKKAHILNFNFNNNKEQYTASNELYSNNQLKQETSIHGNNIFNIKTSAEGNKTLLKSNLVSNSLMNIKLEQSTSNISRKQSNSIDHHAASINQYTLSTTTGN